MKLNYLAILGGAALLLASCSSSNTTLPYFTDLPNNGEGTLSTLDYVTTIRPDDELMIVVSSSYPEAAIHYNLPQAAPATREEMIMYNTQHPQTYIVSSDGYINMPVLGKIYVVGKTTEDLQKQLTETIQKDVADVVVRVEMVNFQVVVAGEVSRPSKIKVTRKRYSILDALGEAGDLTVYGQRNNVLLIREENGERKYVRLNLNSSEVLTSPYFYLKQNDYIYVEPNNIRQANSRYNQDNAYKLTVISTVVSACSVIASLVIALAIK